MKAENLLAAEDNISTTIHERALRRALFITERNIARMILCYPIDVDFILKILKDSSSLEHLGPAISILLKPQLVTIAQMNNGRS